MKKLLLTIAASLSIVGSAQAALSNLYQSAAYFTAIISSSQFGTVIPPNQFVTEIKRKTSNIDAAEAVYEIKTRDAETIQGSHSHHPHTHKYYAHITVTPNPGIGPDILTVTSIVPK